MNYCRKCGYVIEPEDKYCKACGCAVVNDLVSPENTEEETNALQPVTSSVTTPVSQKTKHIKIIPIVITASAITAAIVLTAIFYKPVLSLYYNYKADSATEDISKLLYSVKSIKIYPNKNSRNTLKMLLTNPKSQEKFNIRSIMSDFSSSLSKIFFLHTFFLSLEIQLIIQTTSLHSIS